MIIFKIPLCIISGRRSRKHPFSFVQHFLGGSPNAKQMSYSAFLQNKFQQLIILRYCNIFAKWFCKNILEYKFTWLSLVDDNSTDGKAKACVRRMLFVNMLKRSVSIY